MAQDEYKQDQQNSRLPGYNRSNGGEEKTPKRGPRFSIYWIYAIVALFLIGYQVMRGVTPDVKEITELKFRQEMLGNNDVDKVEPVMNKKIVRVYIKKESLKKDIYRELLGDRWTSAYNSKNPQFQFTYSKVEDYQQYLDEYFK